MGHDGVIFSLKRLKRNAKIQIKGVFKSKNLHQSILWVHCTLPNHLCEAIPMSIHKIGLGAKRTEVMLYALEVSSYLDTRFVQNSGAFDSDLDQTTPINR